MAPSLSDSGPAAAQVDALAHERFVDAFLMQSSRSQLSLIPVSALVATFWHEAVPGNAPWVWLAAACGLSLWRHLYTARTVRAVDARRSTRRIAAMLLAGGGLQAVPLVAFGELGDAGRGALTLILVTLATVSVITTSGFRQVFMAYALPMLLPLSIAWLALGIGSGKVALTGLGATIVLYCAFLLAIGRHANAMFMDSCAYRFGEQQLNRELKLALAEADEANRAKTHFLAAASHDLRQPIHSMNVLVAALSLKTLDEPTREIVGLLAAVNQALSRQLDTLLDISKLDAGVIHADLAHCRLDTLLRTHHAAIEPLARQKGLKLELQVDEPVWVDTDPALLTRALSNLTDNALKYTPRGGTVRLELRRLADSVRLCVSDTGIGIPQAEHERVFREFYQVGNVERDRSKGLGLGLSIVRRLARLLNMELALDSEPGLGTAVTLTLDAAPGPHQEAAPEDPAPERPRGLRVLVIDDEPMVRQSMRLLLQGLHCHVLLADGVQEAARLAQAHPLDLVLSDLRLRDGESGLVAVRSVRARQPGVGAVLITGDTAPDRIREAEDAGVPLLFKPVTLDDLIDVLHRYPSNQGTTE